MSILGVDWGEKRIGLAISRNDIAFDFKTLIFDNFDNFLKEIKKIIEDEKVEKIIFGISKNKEGKIGFQAKKQLVFVKRLKRELNLEIILEDEIFTSKEAKRYLQEQNISRDKIDKLINQKAAQLILQAYLDRMNKKEEARKVDH